MKLANSPGALRRVHRMRGMTMVELLMVIVVVAILMTIGVPSYRYVTNSNRVASEVNSLLGDLQYARGEAIRTGSNVIVCISTNQTSCTGATGSWHTGWIVFADLNGNGAVDANELLRAQKPFTSTDTLTAGAFSAVTFTREGFATGVPAGQFVTLHDATTTSAWTRCLSIGLVGQMSLLMYNQTFNGNTCT